MMHSRTQSQEPRVAVAPDFEWDGQDTYLFDIDGPLAAASRDRIHMDSVATGRSSFNALLQHKPEVCASSLADLLAVRRAEP